MAKQKIDQGTLKAMRILREINAAKNHKLYDRFVKDGEDITRRYANRTLSRGNVVADEKTQYNVFWSTIETLAPTYFARVPKPVIERPLHNSDQIGELMALIEERTLITSLVQERDNFFYTAKQCVQDMLLPGRGIAAVEFHSDFRPVQNPDGTQAVDEQGQPIEAPTNERATVKYLHWKDYLEAPSRYPQECHWKAIRMLLTREELVKEFGEIGNTLKLNYADKTVKDDYEEDTSYFKKCEVWKYFDFTEKKIYWVTEGHEKPLKEQEDPWGLEAFYPMPRPLCFCVTNESTIPTSLYVLTRKILKEMDYAHKRISALMECVRFVGFHDENWNKEIVDLRDRQDGTSQPTKNWATFAEKGGFSGIMAWIAVEQIAKCIQQLTEYAQFLLNAYYEISGIPDIARGASNPNETATAQQIKGNFTVIRTADKQQEVQRFLRDLLDIKAQMIFELFSDETIMKMCGFEQMTQEQQAIFPQALQALRDDKVRTFRVEVETDSTIAVDEQALKQSRMEFLQAFGTIIQQAYQMQDMDPSWKKLAFRTIKFGAEAFKDAKELTADIDQAIRDVEEAERMAAQNPEPPPPSPEEIKLQQEMQAKQYELQIKEQAAMADASLKKTLADHKITLENMEMLYKAQLEREKMNAEMAVKAEKIRADMAIKAMEAADQQRFQVVEGLKKDKEKQTPIIVNLQQPSGRKAIRIATDPVTGEKVGIAEDIQ